MDQTIVTRNYFTDEGDTLVIGGKLIIEEGAEIEGLNGEDAGGTALPPIRRPVPPLLWPR